MAGGGSSMDAGEPEFQVAPMIDVLLVLLIFFMSITTAQTEALDSSIVLPVAPNATERKPDPNQRTVNVRWDKAAQKTTLFYQGQEWPDTEALAAELAQVASQNAKLEVLIRADKACPAKHVYAAMQVVGQATASVAFATFNQ